MKTTKKIELLQKLDTQLSTYNCVDHNIIIGGDWNFILNKDLDAEGGNPQLKLSSIAEIVKLKNKYDLIDIFRVRFPESKRFTYRQNSPRRLRRLDYFIVSNSLQESISKVDVLASVSSDHSPVFLKFSNNPTETWGSSY